MAPSGIQPVDVVTGPGNAWVAEAKRQLYGVVGIDMVAGPSEILVISDNKSDPDWVAADLLSQAEHDPAAQSILITDDAAFADVVADAVDVMCAQLATSETALASWDDYGVMIVVDDLAAQAPPLANRLAAEHVELMVDDPDAMFAQIRHAGSACSSVATRPKPWAIMSPGRTTCCPLAAARALPAGCRCSIS